MNIEAIIIENKLLSPFTSWQVGGSAQYYAAPESLEQLKALMIHAHKNHWPLSILGGGTNVLVSDEGVKGLVLHTHRLNQITSIQEGDQVVVEALCGTLKSEVLKVFMKYHLLPSVFLAGLPGDMAGGVVMNAGVGHRDSPKEFSEIVQEFDVLSLSKEGKVEEKTFSHQEVQWLYRKTKGWQPGIISKVRVCWPNEPDEGVLKAVRWGNKRRKETQPLSEPSCGSVFKNPEGDSVRSGALIESCGLKGARRGGAQVSEKHANFIVNKGGATASDIHELMEYVQKTVKEKHQVELTNEVVYLGFISKYPEVPQTD